MASNKPQIVEIDGDQAIQYVELDRQRVAVYLGTGNPRGPGGRRYRRAGTIRRRNATRPDKPQGWQYVPEGKREGGEVFTDLAACKSSVEGRTGAKEVPASERLPMTITLEKGATPLGFPVAVLPKRGVKVTSELVRKIDEATE